MNRTHYCGVPYIIHMMILFIEEELILLFNIIYMSFFVSTKHLAFTKDNEIVEVEVQE